MKYDPKIHLSDSEKDVRKDWRLAFSIFSFTMLALNSGAVLSQLLESDATLAYILLGFTLCQAVSFAILYYFAFVKFGTKWIGVFMFTSVSKSVGNFLKETFMLMRSPDLTSSEMIIESMGHILFLSLLVYFLMHCLRLYRLNRNLKKRKNEIEILDLQPTMPI